MKEKQTRKLNDDDLWKLIEEKITQGQYLFSVHSRKRQIERLISDIEILDILENKEGSRRHRNKRKDTYDNLWNSWKYCIEGQNPNANKIRIIITFSENMMPIITVMWIR